MYKVSFFCLFDFNPNWLFINSKGKVSFLKGLSGREGPKQAPEGTCRCTQCPVFGKLEIAVVMWIGFSHTDVG